MAAAGVRRAGGRFRERETWTGGGASGYYYFLGGGGGGGGDGFSRVLEEASAPGEDAPATAGREPPPAAAAASAMAARITPAVLFVTVVLAVVLLVSGLLHVLRRLFLKTNHARAGGGERQLQHLLFPGHEDGAGGSGGGGLAQAAIDALPEFAYAELSGAASAATAASAKGKEKAARPFDCAVCLSEFADHDRLRLLPSCGHAFHVACIDVWLRSSATCPLCRTKLSAHHLAAAAAAGADAPSAGQDAEEQKQQQQDQAPDEAASSSIVLPVRLGRFTSADGDGDGDAEASTSDSSRIDGRRCYSMGSYQYVLADEHLLVSVHKRHGNAGGAGTACVAGTAGAVAASGGGGGPQQQGKKVFARGDSFSVSKIWQWRGSKRLPVSLCAEDSLPWAPAAKVPAGTHTRQQQRGDT